MRSESSVERAVCRRVLKQFGIDNIKLNGPGRRGWPDREFLVGYGQVLFVEFKRPGEKPTALQSEIHRRLREVGYEVEVHDNVEAAVAAVNAAALRASQVSARRG